MGYKTLPEHAMPYVWNLEASCRTSIRAAPVSGQARPGRNCKMNARFDTCQFETTCTEVSVDARRRDRIGSWSSGWRV